MEVNHGLDRGGDRYPDPEPGLRREPELDVPGPADGRLHGRVAGGEIAVDFNELEDAAWFRRDALTQTFFDKSIAGWMLATFGKCGQE
jgi:hypothetical protein